MPIGYSELRIIKNSPLFRTKYSIKLEYKQITYVLFFIEMKDYAEKFYKSKQWRDVRRYIIERDLGLCCRCGKPGNIVHHKIYITPENINDPNITLNEDNLETLCEVCHNQEHKRSDCTADGLRFDSKGDLIQVSSGKA